MNVLRWVPLLGAAIIGLHLLVDHTALEPGPRARQTWKETARTLSRDEMRQVARAVRRGVTVEDPELADAAVDFAALSTTTVVRTPLRRLADGFFVVWITAPVVINAARHRWGWMALAAAGPIFFGSLFFLGARFRRAAARAVAANLAIPRPRPPAVEPPTPPPRSRPWPSWTCPHCERMNVHPDDVERRYCRWCDHLCDEVPPA